MVDIIDRGPYIKGRIIDLSYAAAESIGMIKVGIEKVKVEVISLPGSRT
ncbi:MAG: RlpA-like double-psi beta-barrel domain-containing protein [Thermodesulfobacteriota bacterium]